jgi:hypothetical protein
MSTACSMPSRRNDGPRPRLVHRLDKDTSGVLLIARTPGSAAFFSKRFSGRTARKIYWALVVGVPDIDDGMIELPLAKQPGTGGEKMMVDESGDGQPARTRYRVIDRRGQRAAWVELQPLTGRTHQLRVHMAAIGHPIVGDGKYGGQDAFLTGSISRKMHLHARRLIIDHPDGDPARRHRPPARTLRGEHGAAWLRRGDGDLAICPTRPRPDLGEGSEEGAPRPTPSNTARNGAANGASALMAAPRLVAAGARLPASALWPRLHWLPSASLVRARLWRVRLSGPGQSQWASRRWATRSPRCANRLPRSPLVTSRLCASQRLLVLPPRGQKARRRAKLDN